MRETHCIQKSCHWKCVLMKPLEQTSNENELGHLFREPQRGSGIDLINADKTEANSERGDVV